MLPTERRRSNSRGSLRIVSGLAENTNSIFCDGSSEPETANGCLVLPSAGTDAERHTWRVEHPGNDACTLSGACPRHPCLHLTDDLHGRRQSGSNPTRKPSAKVFEALHKDPFRNQAGATAAAKIGLPQLSPLYGLGCLGSYRPISPPPGSRIFVIEPQRASTTSAHSTPLACNAAISFFRSSHIR